MKDKYLRKLNIELVDGEYENVIQEQLRSPDQIHAIFNKLKDKAEETALCLYLWDDLQPSVYSVLSVGSQDSASIDTKTLFGLAFTLRARYFILVHNHPKGGAHPSDEDKRTIKELQQRASLVDVDMLDFIIIADDGYWSHFEEAAGGEYALGSVSL